MREYFLGFIKGIGMGAANVIPGVSGGTIAFITGIFERLVNALKSFNLTAIKLFFTGKFKKFAEHTDLYFLISVFLGVGISIITFAKLLQYLFEHYEVMVWAYFFGLILASVYYVGKTISKWTWSVITLFILGFVIAFAFTMLTPARETNTVPYNLFAGAIAACAMILPGLSGSFVLLLLGNYQLIMIESVSNFDFTVLIPVVIGAVLGLIAFSYFLSWVFAKYKDQTISLLTGFILGSLAIIWPWKKVISTYTDRYGELRPQTSVNVMPDAYSGDPQIWQAILLMILGIITIVVMEYIAEKSKKQSKSE
ncbi:MAG TPA: DUF368 domain-containing protein [Salinivirgaceae bacterium]|nr:DUF368 domain-containing protein [Salinivirgaceae bacterium]HQA75958.1 DUF368 domain-containing protein [Salinivirgaceae bacterium]